MTLSLERINKAREAGYDDDKIVESISRKDPEFGSRIEKAKKAGHSSADILKSIEKRLNTPAKEQNTPASPVNTPANTPDVKRALQPSESKKGYIDLFKKGLQQSASGELATLGQKSQQEMGEDPGFWEALVQEGGTITGDFPYLLAGSTLGASVGAALGAPGGPWGSGAGGLVGAGFGALAFPEFIKSALKEYKDYAEKGNDITFGEFLERAERVGSKTLNAGLMGSILGMVNKAAPLLKNIPGIGNLFSSKIAQKAATVTGEAALASGVPAISEGRLPEGKDFAHALAVVLGFNALHIPKSIRDKLNAKGEDSGLTPEQYAKSLQRDEIEGISKMLKETPQEAEKPLSERKATILQSTETTKTRNLTEAIKTEQPREKITERRPENVTKSNKVILEDLADTKDTIDSMPNTNKKKLAKQAFQRGYISTPEQLNLFLDEYEATYKSLPGNTGLKKNSKFLNKYASKNFPEIRTFEVKNEPPIVDVKPTPERLLEIGRTQKREARLEDNEAKRKEAQKRIDLSKRKIKSKANKKQEASKENVKPEKEFVNPELPKQLGITFTTEKGSEYTVEGNKTTRNKAYRPEHGEKEQGLQPKSQETFYVKPEDAIKLSEFQTQGPKKALAKFPDGRVGVMYFEGPNAGKVSRGSVVTPEYEPKVGLHPVEIWNNGQVAHFGNKIIKISSKPQEMSVKKTKTKKKAVKPEPKPKEPIIEETGEGANERLEEPQTKLQKIQEKASDALEAVKNPKELSHQIYTKTFDALEPLNRLEIGIPTEERVTTKIKQAQSAASDINNILTQGVFDNASNMFVGDSLKNAYAGTGEVWQRAVKGLKHGDYSIREMDVYRTSKEALKRQKRGLKSGVDTAIAEQDVARLKQKYGPIDQRLHQYQKTTVQHYGENILGQKVIDQWTQDSHASLYRSMDYGKDAVAKEGSLAPKKNWFRAKGSERKILPPSETDILNLSMLVTNAKKNDSILQYKKLVEQGKLPGKVVKSKNRALPEKLMEDLGIDPDSIELAETLYNQSRKDAFTPETGRLKGWEKGDPFEIEVPLDVYETYTSMAPTDTGTLTRVFRATNNLMSKLIVLEPVKFLSIFGRDAYSSLIYSKTGSNPLSIVRALTDIYKDSHSWNQFKSLGGEQYAARLMTRLDRVEKIDSLLKAERPNAVLVPYHKLSNFLSKHSQNLVASVPFAEYQRAVKKYGDTPIGRLQALIEAKSVTYDPTKKGSSKLVEAAANFAPFFNVMLQEPAMIAKHMKRPMFWAKGMVAMTIPSLVLKAYNDGNPDYDDMNPLLKASCWHFYTPLGHFACPVPWLLGALFKSTPELLYDLAKGEGGDAWKGLYSYVASQLSGTFPPIVQAAVEQSTEESLPSPLGLAVMPFADIEKRAPPVVPKRLQNLPPEQQYTSKTSQLARWYGDMWGASPVKVERLIKSFTGGVGSDALALIDEMVYATGLAEDKRPDQGVKNYLIFGKFLSENTPANTKYTSEFYNLLEQAKMEEKREKPNNLKQLNTANSAISKKLRAYRDVEESSINPSEKRERLNRLQKELNSMYKEAVLRNKK